MKSGQPAERGMLRSSRVWLLSKWQDEGCGQRTMQPRLQGPTPEWTASSRVSKIPTSIAGPLFHGAAKGNGEVAQLGERCVRNAEVGSSILLFSTRSTRGLPTQPFLLPCSPQVPPHPRFVWAARTEPFGQQLTAAVRKVAKARQAGKARGFPMTLAVWTPWGGRWRA